MKNISKLIQVSVQLVAASALFGADAYSVGEAATVEQFKRIKVVYGKDDRLDTYQVSSPALLRMADATAAMVPLDNISVINQVTTLRGDKIGNAYGLCKDEPYYSQPNAAVCSGFLVGPDLLATAGHCVSDVDCGNQVFVFDYKMEGPGKAPLPPKADDMYKCKKVIARELTRAQDYSLIQLDRPVVGHQPVAMSTTPAKAGDPLVLIGHPAGLPTKIAGGANVRKVETGYFSANTDSYGGNSGSAVFNPATGEIVGILVRGEEDFKYDSNNQCVRSNYCADGDCRGEDVTQIEYVIKNMPK